MIYAPRTFRLFRLRYSLLSAVSSVSFTNFFLMDESSF